MKGLRVCERPVAILGASLRTAVARGVPLREAARLLRLPHSQACVVLAWEEERNGPIVVGERVPLRQHRSILGTPPFTGTAPREARP